MPIDTRKEDLLSLTEASAATPRHRSVSTMWRWCQQGVRGVTLETVMVGGRRYTSVEAMDRFFDRVNTAPRSRQVQMTDMRRKHRKESSTDVEIVET